tara:strand:- start:1106 stop:1357 length:252 start_codon:yes stop_codon:yes gene_type:complete
LLNSLKIIVNIHLNAVLFSNLIKIEEVNMRYALLVMLLACSDEVEDTAAVEEEQEAQVEDTSVEEEVEGEEEESAEGESEGDE